MLFLNQYSQLHREFPRVDFVAQGNFKRAVFNLMSIPLSKWSRFVLKIGVTKRATNKYVLFLVDDNIFVRDFCLSDVTSALYKEKKSLGFALQLGENINYCYPLDIPLTFPAAFPVFGDIIKYRWSDASNGLNYPLEVSRSIYRLTDIARLLAGLSFSNPNTLEAHMAMHVRHFRRSHPYLLCYRQSVTFCNPVNKVQNIYANKAGDRPGYSASTLAQLFEQGYCIDVTGYDGFIPAACHQELELVLSKSI